MTDAEKPEPPPDPGAPKGEMIELNVESKIFPGCEQKVDVYVPAQYKPLTPACLMVKLDGFPPPEGRLFDGMIARKEIPVMIAIGLHPGVIYVPGETDEKKRQGLRFNRSYEFDSVNDNLPNYFANEVLPAVSKLITKDGRAIRISSNAADHGVYGGSTGGIGSFTLAWKRPDLFSRVYTIIGTYVSMRGGHEYPALIRKTTPKPLRLFLEDGATDAWNPLFGSWFAANQNMESALSFAGYDVQHIWGDHGHNGKAGHAIFPEVMKWLWHDWPAPIKTGVSQNNELTAILAPNEDWQLVGSGYGSALSLASNPQGEVQFNDAATHTMYRVGAGGKAVAFNTQAPALRAAAFGPDGTLYGAGADGKVITIDAAGAVKTIADGIKARGIVVDSEKNVFVTAPGEHTDQPSKIWRISATGEKKQLDEGLSAASGLAFSPDKAVLFAAERTTRYVYSYICQPDGSLLDRQPFFWLHLADMPNESGAEDMAVSHTGDLFVATRMGVQVADPNGRVRAILPLPTPCGPLRSLAFGGEGFNVLYATDGNKVFRRQLKAVGCNQWAPPLPHPAGGAG